MIRIGISGWRYAPWRVHVYFDNDVKVRAPFDALALMRRLRVAWRPEGSNGHRDLPRRLPGASIPRVKGGFGPRVTGRSAWAGLGRAGTRAPRCRRAGG